MISSQAATSRPGTGDGKPAEIQVFGAILDVDKIDSAEQNFTLNFYVMFRWNEHRLAHDQEGSVMRNLSEIWNPRLTITNTQGSGKIPKTKACLHYDGILEDYQLLLSEFSMRNH